tara:strand:+ start:365 stop:928 length:564 start_codon:yes stop_codon:yes gene_type:complete
MATATTGLSTFKTALEYGGARPSLFDFKITAAPTGVSTNLSNVNYYCNVSALPGLTLTPIERQYYGRTVKIPGDLVFADLTTTIINTENYNVRNEIEKWMEHINGSIDNVSQADADFGTGTATLTHYQKDGTATMVYEFVDCWPTTLSEIALSYDTASDIEQFDVTWAYNYFTMSGSGVAIGNSTQG